MKRLVSTRHPGSDARVNMRARLEETRVKTRGGNLPAFPTGAKCTYKGNIQISRRQYRGLSEFAPRRERAHFD